MNEPVRAFHIPERKYPLQQCGSNRTSPLFFRFLMAAQRGLKHSVERNETSNGRRFYRNRMECILLEMTVMALGCKWIAAGGSCQKDISAYLRNSFLRRSPGKQKPKNRPGSASTFVCHIRYWTI
jgi:hypothetical protein